MNYNFIITRTVIDGGHVIKTNPIHLITNTLIYLSLSP